MSARFALDDLLGLASDLDEGFTPDLLAEMLASHRRFTDEDFTELGGDASRLRAFVEEWRTRLIHRD